MTSSNTSSHIYIMGEGQTAPMDDKSSAGVEMVEFSEDDIAVEKR